MNNFLRQFDSVYLVIGRSLLGAYFLIPGIMKIINYANTLGLMLSKNIPFAAVLLPLTAALQIGLGMMLILAKNTRVNALLLFGMTLVINFYVHNFWALQGEPAYAHELQNFVKNLGIAAGLLVLAGNADSQLTPSKT